MKICHFADTHIDASRDGPTDPVSGLNGRVLDFLDSLDILIDYCIENDADIVLFAGDAFHRHSPNSVILNEFARRIRRLSDHCPVVMLVGNHDVPGNDPRKASSAEIYKSLDLKRVIVGSNYEILPIMTKKNEIIQVATFPYPSRHVFKGKKEIHRKIKEMEKSVAKSAPCVFLGHFTVSGGKMGSEQSYVTAVDGVVEKEVLENGPWDYVALGHLHMYQCLNEGAVPPIVYSGSLDRIDFGEESSDKGFVWVEIDDETIEFSLVSVSPRPMVTLNFKFGDDSRHITNYIVKAINSEDIQDAIVRTKIALPEHMESRLQMDRVYEALKACHFIHSVSITRVSGRRPTRLGELDMPLLEVPSLELLDRYFANVAGIGGKEKKELLSLASTIMEECNDN